MPRQPPRIAHCLSYTPLLRGEPGVDLAEDVYRRPERLRQIFSRTVSGLATACLRLMQDDSPVPVFVYERGSEIHAHLLVWTENDPPAWFTLYLSELPDEPPGYLVVLQPRIDRSVERFKRAFPPGLLDEATIEVIFSPLYFIGTGTSYRTLEGQDWSQVSAGHPRREGLQPEPAKRPRPSARPDARPLHREQHDRPGRR